MDVPLSAEQITSVAAGSSKKITETYTLSSSYSVSTSTSTKSLSSAVESELASDVERKIETIYEGPSIDSGYVSIIYWITPFVDRGTFSAEGTGNLCGDTFTASGTFQDAKKFVEWSQLIK